MGAHPHVFMDCSILEVAYCRCGLSATRPARACAKCFLRGVCELGVRTVDDICVAERNGVGFADDCELCGVPAHAVETCPCGRDSRQGLFAAVPAMLQLICWHQ